MVWLPDHVWEAQKASKGGGKGGGSGKGTWKPQFQKTQPWLYNALAAALSGKAGGKGKGKGKFGLRNFKPECKVWIGSLPSGTKWKELQEHMNQAGPTKWVEVFGGKGEGTGAVAYAKAEEAQAAISILNGSSFNGAVLMCDAWEKKQPAA